MNHLHCSRKHKEINKTWKDNAILQNLNLTHLGFKNYGRIRAGFCMLICNYMMLYIGKIRTFP